MPPKTADVTCIGLANVDVIATVTDEFLEKHNMTKAATTPLDASTTGMILGKLENPSFYPGGCAANTACGLALMGIDTAFCGKTGDDTYAGIFSQGFEENTVHYLPVPPAPKMTSTCLTLVTPDKDRSFALCKDTAGWFLKTEDLPDIEAGTGNSVVRYVYIEANMAQVKTGENSNLLRDVVQKYDDPNIRVVVNLNDKEIVTESFGILKDLLDEDIFFFIGNIAEFNTLFETQTQEDAFAKALETGGNFAITDGPNGACIVGGGDIVHVPANKMHISRIVNTIGAGDQFAAGFLAGLVNGLPFEEACRKGVDAATEIIQTLSARPGESRYKAARKF